MFSKRTRWTCCGAYISRGRAFDVTGFAGGCFDFKASRTVVEFGLLLSTGCLMRIIPSLPFCDRSFKAASVFPLNIRFEKDRAGPVSASLFAGLVDFKRRLCSCCPSKIKEFISPSVQEFRCYSRQTVRSLHLYICAGF